MDCQLICMIPNLPEQKVTVYLQKEVIDRKDI